MQQCQGPRRCEAEQFLDAVDIIERKPDMGSKILFQLATVISERLMKTTEKMTLINQAKGVNQNYEEVV